MTIDGPVFDSIAEVTAAHFHAPVALVAFVNASRQRFAGQVGLDEPWATERETPLDLSFCRVVVARGEIVSVANAHDDPDFRGHHAIAELGVIAYLGAPVLDAGGAPLGSVCAIDHVPRTWGPRDEAMIARLARLASAVVSG